jgi:hypothetical protein
MYRLPLRKFERGAAAHGTATAYASSMRTIGMTVTEVCWPGDAGSRDRPRLLAVGVVAVLLCCTARPGDGLIRGGGTVSAVSRGVLAVVGTAADGIETLRTGLVEPAIALGGKWPWPLRRMPAGG